MRRISIRTLEWPADTGKDNMVHWFCAAFGFSSLESEWGVEEQLLAALTDAAYRNEGITSADIRFKGVARSTVIYHLNRFIEAGLVVKRGRWYYLRGMELSKALEEIEYDIGREMRRLIDFAKMFDEVYKRQTVSQGLAGMEMSEPARLLGRGGRHGSGKKGK